MKTLILIFLVIVLDAAYLNAQWVKQSSPLTNVLTSVYFIDQNTGWAVGVDDLEISGEHLTTILKTTDGGENWVRQSSEIDLVQRSVHLNAVYFIDSNTGWAVGSNSTVIKTTNGGLVWKDYSFYTPDNYGLNSVYFADYDTGWAVGRRKNGQATIFKTTDGGINWVLKSVNVDKDLLSVHFYADQAFGWAVGAGGTIIKTIDGGESWTSQTSGTSNALWSVYFIDADTGWASGINGTILKTTNGGTEWEPHSIANNRHFFSIFFVDQNQGWAAGYGDFISYGIIFMTTDGGVTWNSQFSGTNGGFYSVYFTGSTGWAVGGNTGSNIIYTTTISGTTPVEQSTGYPAIFSLHQNFPNPFNPTTTLSFAIGHSSFVTLKVCDVLGNELATLVNEEKASGSYEVTFDASGLSSGVYFYRIQAGNFSEIRKMILLR